MMRLLALLLFLTCALPAAAQNAVDYEAWEGFAVRAERVVEDAAARNQVLLTLREDVDAFRAQFLEQQDLNAARLDTLRGQLDALGAPPGEGETEADDIAARRAELNAQITELAAPGLRAQEAFSRADGIIGEIDNIIRERRAAALLSRGPTPLNPAIWPEALEALGTSGSAMAGSVANARADGGAAQALSQNLPPIVLLIVIAIVFVLRGRRWLEELGARIEARGDGGAGLRLSSFLISLGQIIVPMVGLVALTRALILTELFADYSEVFLAFIPAFGLAFFVALWLAGRLFPNSEGVQSPLDLPEQAHRGARFVLLLLGSVLSAFAVLRAMAEVDGYSTAARAALEFPFYVAIGYFLFRIGRTLALHRVTLGPEGEPLPSVNYRLVLILSRMARIVGIVGPLLAALGYLNGTAALLIPSVQTLALFAVLALLINAVRDAYVLASGDGAEESLAPVLIAIILFAAAVPILALVWGATLNDLGEIWVAIQAGVTVGETTISPTSFFVLIIVFLLGYGITRFVQSALRSSVLPKTKLDIGGQTAITSGLGYVGFFIAGLVAITAAGIDLTSLAFIAGALGVGIGFGLQNIVSNFISGIILLVERPISEGDWIEVGGNMGFVRDISVRSTRIETFDRTDVIIPNADLISGTVTNYTRGNTVGRALIAVGVAYGTDTRRVEKILQEIAEAHPMVSLNPPPFVLFKGFGADSLDFEIRAILRDVTWINVVITEINHAIAERFTAEGIEIPFAQRDIWLRNPEALGGGGAASAKSAALPEPARDATGAKPGSDDAEAGETES